MECAILPVELLYHIGQFIQDPDILINFFNAFDYEEEDESDIYINYKREVHDYISCIMYDKIISELKTKNMKVKNMKAKNLISNDSNYAHELTSQDIMCIFVTMFGSEPEYTDKELNRIMDVSDFIPKNHDFELAMYKYVCLLESSIRASNITMINWLQKHNLITITMCWYIYLLHNHKHYGPNKYSLANNSILINLFVLYGKRTIIDLLKIAISGARNKIIITTNDYYNSIVPNLDVCKLLVPTYIDPNDLIPLHDQSIDIANIEYPELVINFGTALQYWHIYDNTVDDFNASHGFTNIIIDEKNHKIRQYLSNPIKI